MQVASHVINLKIIHVSVNTKNAEIINDELIMCIFKVVASDKQ